MNSSLPAGSYTGGAVSEHMRTATERGPLYRGGAQSITSGKLDVQGPKSCYIGLGNKMALFDHVGLIPSLKCLH